MPSVTAISSGVRSSGRTPCTTRRHPCIDPRTQLSLQHHHGTLALESGFTRSHLDTYICSYAFVRAHAYRYEHMFPRRTPSPLTRRARTALSLARSFLLLEDDYDVDWEVDQDETGRDRSKIDGISDRPARGRASADHPGHPHRAALRGRSARVRAGQPVQAAHVCLSPVERPSMAGTVRHVAPTKTGRPRATRN
jgi:hypothetical protein